MIGSILRWPRGAVVLALALAVVPHWEAFGQQRPSDPHPLRPADTSSPRDTLRTFLSDVTTVAEEFLLRGRGRTDETTNLARERAAATLDLSATPDGSFIGVQDERALLLKEILDRIELPPYDQIPGDAEVADGSITSWTIPHTRITIERVPSGPRAGEFLFSAGSVDRLNQFYDRVKHLPYKRGATVGAYEKYVRSDRTIRALTRQVRARLKPIDTSTPRSTLEGFLDAVNRAHTIVMDADAALRADPPAITRERALEREQRAHLLLERAGGALDLSQVPEALRQDLRFEATLQLKEILDRIALPPLESVPGARRVAAHRQSGEGGALRWRIPATKLEILEITEGDREDEFLFSAATVERIAELYDGLRDLPYRSAEFSGLFRDYVSPGTSPGFYDFYISSPGYLLPRASRLGRLIDGLPDSLKTQYAGQTLWQWLALLLCVLILPLAVTIVSRIVTRAGGSARSPWDDWLKIVTPLIIAFIVLRLVGFLDAHVNLSGQVLSIVRTGARLTVLAMAVWAVFTLCKAVAETIVSSERIAGVTDQSPNSSVVRITARVVAFLAGAWIVVAGIRSLGVDAVPLLAGLGVGGLAVALAAQTSIANFIGSLILLTVKPVRIGDFCRYGDQIGTVEHIGLHSTRIRSLERTVVTVPNAEFSQIQLDNFSARDQRLFRTTLHLRYETTPEQLRYVLANTRGLLLGHPKVTPAPARVRFEGYGPGSKKLGIFAYLRCQDQNTFLAIQEDLLLRIEDIVSEAGTAFAIPAQTSYLAQAPALDAERAGEAEAHVGQWRSEERLPFPEFAEEERRQLTDVLDYPPEGSPDHRPRADSPKAKSAPQQVGGARSSWSRLLGKKRDA